MANDSKCVSRGAWIVLLAGASIGAPPAALARQAQGAAPAQSSATGAPAAPASDVKPMSDEELAQILAPLALYPDSLLSQVLMASTYPLEIVQADRWAKANKSLTGNALAAELEKQPWDPSVKSLVNFPDVLSGLSDKLDWTVKVGDAFLADQKRVLGTVQMLRAKAKDAGNLKTTQEQNVTVTPASGSQTQTIVIESSSPEVVYVPTYNTTVVYGAWPYPAYPPPPPPYYPPSYSASAALVGFGVGVACGAAWGYAWGDCNWGGGDVNINVNKNTNFNNNINRASYQNVGAQGGTGAWQHDASHRQGAAYRDSATANRYGGQGSQRTAGAGDQFRGRADAPGAGDAGRAGAGGAGAAGAAGVGAAGAGAGAGAGRAGAGGAGSTGGGATSRGSSSAGSRSPAGGGGAMSGHGGGEQTRAASSRGNSSRSSGGASRGGGGGRGGGGRG